MAAFAIAWRPADLRERGLLYLNMNIETFDIIVVGGGNAGFSAALSSKEAVGPDARVLVIDKALGRR